jgi:hypothetical protein
MDSQKRIATKPSKAKKQKRLDTKRNFRRKRKTEGLSFKNSYNFRRGSYNPKFLSLQKLKK